MGEYETKYFFIFPCKIIVHNGKNWLFACLHNEMKMKADSAEREMTAVHRAPQAL